VGQAEWMLVVTIGSLVGVGSMGMNLAAALWTGRHPRPVSMTTWLGVLVLAGSVLWMRWGDDDTQTLVAAVATAQPTCAVSSAPVGVETYPGGARLDGAWTVSRGCHIWAVIQDPRTGTFWLQGPASIADAAWTLPIALASDESTSEQLHYLVSVAAVDDETHSAWLTEARALDGIVSREQEIASAWLARRIALDGAR
jgi:hypothetical protein